MHLWNPQSYFFTKNKFGDGSPPSYRSATGEEEPIESENEPKNTFTINTTTYKWLIEILEEFGKMGGFQYLNQYFSTINNIDTVALFFKVSSNSIHLLSVRNIYKNYES